MLFSRNPNSGDKELFGEYLPNAEGDDIASGVRTPMSLMDFRREHSMNFERLQDIAAQLEGLFKDMVVSIRTSISISNLYIPELSYLCD